MLSSPRGGEALTQTASCSRLSVWSRVHTQSNADWALGAPLQALDERQPGNEMKHDKVVEEDRDLKCGCAAACQQLTVTCEMSE